MFPITREMIKHLASSETVYYRGMRYYADRAVSQVTWSGKSRQYRAIVRGSNQYAVTVQMESESMDISYSCNCPAHITYTGACKHVVATLLFICDYNERENQNKKLSEDDKQAYQVISYFKKQEYKKLQKTCYHLKVHIQLPTLLHRDSERVHVSLYAGSDRMYKVGNIRKFLADYFQGATITLGKEFCYHPKECCFDETSAAVLDFFLTAYEMQEMLGKGYFTTLFSGSSVLLSQTLFYRLLQRMQGETCELMLYGKNYGEVAVCTGNPAWELALFVQGETLTVASKDVPLIPLCKDGSIMYYAHGLYLPDAEYVWNVLPFFASVEGEGHHVLSFQGENFHQFMEHVLPRAGKALHLLVPDEVKERYVVEELQADLYLDAIVGTKKKKYIAATVFFNYGTQRINPLERSKTPKGVLVVRNRQREDELIDTLYTHHFQPYGEQFVLKNEEDIYQFLRHGMKELMQDFALYYSGNYKKISLHNLQNGKVAVRLSEDMNLLEMDLAYENLPMEELADFFKSLRLKKKYYRLRDGSFLSLEEEETIREAKNLYRLYLESEDMQEGRMHFQKNRSYYLDRLLSDWREIEVKREPDYITLVEALEYPDEESIEVPPHLKEVLRPYQTVGYRWLMSLSEMGFGGILADDMGLGKTLQSISYICAKGEARYLVVCPSSLMINWQEEFARFAPQVPTCIVCGNPAQRHQLLKQGAGWIVLITSYPLLRRDIEEYEGWEFDTVFIDEAQYIKNLGSLCAKSVKKIKAKHRFALTGTPMENSLSDLWSIFDFIMPGYLPKYSRFVKEYEKPIVKEKDEEAVFSLTHHIKPFILRRMKQEVLLELPEKIETYLPATMHASQKKVYDAYLATSEKETREKLLETAAVNYMAVFTLLTRLRQICNHPSTFMEQYKGGSGKLELFTELIEQLLSGGHQVLVFSQFTSMLAILEKRLKEMEIPYLLMQGDTKMGERAKLVKRFNKGEVSVFLLSRKVGGMGLNLTAADTVIHYDPWWNPAVEDQATDRAYRIGQRRTVQVYKLYTKGTIEEKIYQLQQRKKELSDTVISSGEQWLQTMSKEEIIALFAP